MICQKSWPPGDGAYFPYISIQKTLKSILDRNHWTYFNIIWQKCFFGDPLSRLFKSETTRLISVLLRRNVPLVALYQDCSSCHDSTENLATSGQDLFSLYSCIENFKNLLVGNHFTDFNIIHQKCSSTKIFQAAIINC